MTSVLNLFSNFDDLSKKKSIHDYASDFNEIKTSHTPALTQGEKFEKYQGKIKKNLEKKIRNMKVEEGFNNLDFSENGLYVQTKKVIQNNDYSSQQQTIDNLRKQYQIKLKEFENLITKINATTNQYISRVGSGNPYLGKNVCLKGGACGYVTNQGVFKLYPSDNNNTFNNTAGKNGCPNSSFIQINVDGDINTHGSIIPSNPPLLVGTPMQSGQSCGNEGTNVYVNQIIGGTSSSYLGCYNDDISSPLMKFIGNSPPIPIVKNGNFEQPQIPNNSYRSVRDYSSVIGWNTGCFLINNSVDWGFPMPYPHGPQAACLQGYQLVQSGYMGQNINLKAGSYILSFSACGRPGYAGANPVSIQIAKPSVPDPPFYTFTPSTTEWKTYSAPFNAPYTGTYAMNWVGQKNSNEYATAIQNIQITDGDSISSGSYSYEQCASTAINSGYKYFSLQNVNLSNSLGYCAVSNDQPTITRLGKSVTTSDQIALWKTDTGKNVGKSASLNNKGQLVVLNSGGEIVFKTDNSSTATTAATTAATGSFFLILQDDGNLCIYKGSSPSDGYGGYVWCAYTQGKQKQPNPDYAAEKGKYGKNWISSGSTLAPGDFIGSTNGNLALIMQTDGNLVLYTFNTVSNCQKMPNGQMGGGVNANAIYGITQVGIPSNVGQLAYVDENANIYNYTYDKYGSSYSQIAQGMDTPGDDIPGAQYGNATVKSCEATCNNLSDCAGFVTNAEGNICWPKTSRMYPYTDNINTNPDRNIYLRNKTPASLPIGVSNTINNIDSIQYQNYINGGKLRSEYGLAQATSVQKHQLASLQSEMNLLASQIATLTGKFGNSSEQTESQSKTNIKGLNGYIKGYKNTNNKIKTFKTGVENILNDSDIVVLQKNYDYLFWSILASGAVLVTMNIVKK